MMTTIHSTQPIQMKIAQNVFEAWDTLGVNKRAISLEKSLQGFSDTQQKMAAWQINNAKKTIAETLLMPGPTGENNTLSSQGRGVFLCHSSIKESESNIGLVGQIFTALIAGNCVITVGSEGQAIMDMLASYVPEGVIQNIADSMLDTIIDADNLAGVAILCDASEVQALNRRLAAKQGLICQLIEETDSKTFSTIAKPHYLLRFITEQTVSNNTTAIGGNATLLELGSMND